METLTHRHQKTKANTDVAFNCIVLSVSAKRVQHATYLDQNRQQQQQSQ